MHTNKLLDGAVCSPKDGHRVSIPNSKQWDYKKGLLMELQLVYLTKKWNMNMDSRNVVVIVLIDFCKTFDTVDHSIMHLKLQRTGLTKRYC